MKNTNIEQIQNEILELTNKIELVKQNVLEIQFSESQKSKIDFETFMEWADNYFTQKDNVYSMTSDLECSLDIDDHCSIDLSLCGNEIEIEKEWRDVDDIVKEVLDLAKEDFKNWMNEEMSHHQEEEVETNEEGDILVAGCSTCGQDVEVTDINGNCKNCK
jgi:hypothetical protein